MFYRRKKSPLTPRKKEKLPVNKRDIRAREPPSNLTGDKELDHILTLPCEATLRQTLLKELLEDRRALGRREALAEAQQSREESVLDPSTAKEVARYLAEKRYSPRTRKA